MSFHKEVYISLLRYLVLLCQSEYVEIVPDVPVIFLNNPTKKNSVAQHFKSNPSTL